MSNLVSVLIVVVCSYLVVLLVVFIGQSGMLYLPDLPSRELAATPQAIGLAYDDVRLQTEDGVELHGWYIPAAAARATLLFFHGNAGNISHRLDSIRIFNNLGLSVLIFDYRGYGQSNGSPSELGTQRDALAAWHYVTQTRGVAPDQVVLFGRSLGGAVAAWLATQHHPAALIVESRFTSVPDIAADVYWWLPARWLSRFDYATRDYVAAVNCPVLVIHSPDDEIIPFRHGEAIHAAAREPKEFLRLRGSHNDGFIRSGETYTHGLDAFLARHLSGCAAARR